jgi:hypothetical protein
MLAYSVEWHMRQLLAPILFGDDDKAQARAARTLVVAAKLKALTKQTGDGMKVHSSQTLIGDLATIVKNRIQPTDKTPRYSICSLSSANGDSAAGIGFAGRYCSTLHSGSVGSKPPTGSPNRLICLNFGCGA